MIKKCLSCLIAVLLIGSYSCSQTKKTTSEDINFEALNMHDGKMIVESVCVTCHDPDASVQDRIAPPLEIIKRNYLSISETESEFIIRMTNFVVHPSPEEAMLHADVDEFGLMDPLGYSEQDIQSVAMYIYRTELEHPDWMNSENEPE
ncbi:MAG: hypothetical protein JJ971_03970 [Balneolaceae bacterium]|nr:hypothetical protein [Balneolaceae bacterium]MBO6545530.1 hypothetical protein [Balneolaceae bacterium]MBO6646926.1 hypothetical protein [Balneolaceae bacterium]